MQTGVKARVAQARQSHTRWSNDWSSEPLPGPGGKQEQDAAAEAERIAWEQADAVAYKLVLEDEMHKEREAANKVASKKGASPKTKK